MSTPISMTMSITMLCICLCLSLPMTRIKQTQYTTNISLCHMTRGLSGQPIDGDAV